MQQAAADVRHRAQERVDRRRAAPLQVVSILANLFPEAGGIALFHALDAQTIAPGDIFHLSAIGGGFEAVSVAAAHVRHVDAQHPQQAVAFTRGDFAQRADGSFHGFVVIGLPARLHAARESSAQHRQHLYVRPEQVLQKHHLKLDGMLDRVAVVFHQRAVSGRARDLVDQGQVGAGFAERSDEGFAREAEAVGLSVMRGAQDHERLFGIGGRERGIRRAIGIDTAKGADVRSRDGPYCVPSAVAAVPFPSRYPCSVDVSSAGLSG